VNEVQAMAKAGQAVGAVLGTAVFTARKAAVVLGGTGAAASRKTAQKTARRSRRWMRSHRTTPRQVQETIVDSAHRAHKALGQQSLAKSKRRAQKTIDKKMRRAQKAASRSARRAQKAAAERITDSTHRAQRSLAGGAYRMQDSLAGGAQQARESLASNVIRARRELAAVIEPRQVRRRRRWPWLLMIGTAIGGAVAYVLARRPQEQSPALGTTTPRAIEPPMLSANGVVPRSTEVRVPPSETPPAEQTVETDVEELPPSAAGMPAGDEPEGGTGSSPAAPAKAKPSPRPSSSRTRQSSATRSPRSTSTRRTSGSGKNPSDG
jgi:hypothetical protein